MTKMKCQLTKCLKSIPPSVSASGSHRVNSCSQYNNELTLKQHELNKKYVSLENFFHPLISDDKKIIDYFFTCWNST